MSNSDDASLQWVHLYDEFKKAQDEYYEAFGIVNARFRAVGTSRSHINPTRDELTNLDEAERKLAAVKQKMDVFLKQYR